MYFGTANEVKYSHQNRSIDGNDRPQKIAKTTKTINFTPNLPYDVIDVIINLSINRLDGHYNFWSFSLTSKKFKELSTKNLNWLEGYSADIRNFIKINDNNLKYFTNLTGLNLKNSYLHPFMEVTGKSISLLTNLTYLNLQNAFRIEDPDLQGLTNLKYLNLRENRKIRGKCLLKLTQLVALDIYDTGIHSRFLTNIAHLTHLSFYNNFHSFDSLSKHSSLISLSFFPSGFKNNEITKLTSLKHLKFYSGFQQEAMKAETINKLTNLVSLHLSLNSSITDNTITTLTNLTSLDLTYNNVITNKGLKKLTNLTALNLSNNRQITIKGLVTLTNLTTLNLGRNIGNYYNLINTSELTNLKKLDLNPIINNSMESRMPKELRLMDTLGMPPWPVRTISW